MLNTSLFILELNNNTLIVLNRHLVLIIFKSQYFLNSLLPIIYTQKFSKINDLQVDLGGVLIQISYD